MNQVAVETSTIRSFSREMITSCADEVSDDVRTKFTNAVVDVRALVMRGANPDGLRAVSIAEFRRAYKEVLAQGQQPLAIKILRSTALYVLAIRVIQDEQRAAVRAATKG